MPVTRCIAEVRFPEVRPGKQHDGEPSDVAYVLAIVAHKEGASRAEILGAASRHVLALRVAEGGTIARIAFESARWNIPALEPEAWRRQEESLRALERRMRGGSER